MELALQGGLSTSLADEILQEAVEFAYQLSALVVNLVRALYRPVAISMAVVGAFLYFSHLHRRLGAQLLKGAIALVIFMELGIPAISYIAKRLGWSGFPTG